MESKVFICKTCQTIDSACIPLDISLCLTTGYKFKSISMSSLGCVLTGYVLATVSMIGLALLGWSSFEFDTNS